MSEPLRAAGGVVTRQSPAGLEILLVHRRRYNDWSLPKGKPEPGETLEQTALREVREETGYDVEIAGFLDEVNYSVGDIPKTVHYWLMRAVGDPGAIEDSDEVAEVEWLPAGQARARLTYPGERELIMRFSRAGE